MRVFGTSFRSLASERLMAEDGTCSWSSCVCIEWGGTQSELIAFARTDTRGNTTMRLTSLLLLFLGVSVPVVSAQTPQGTTQDGESLYADAVPSATNQASRARRTARHYGDCRQTPSAWR